MSEYEDEAGVLYVLLKVMRWDNFVIDGGGPLAGPDASPGCLIVYGDLETLQCNHGDAAAYMVVRPEPEAASDAS